MVGFHNENDENMFCWDGKLKPSVHLLVAVYLVMVTAVSNVMSSSTGHLDSVGTLPVLCPCLSRG